MKCDEVWAIDRSRVSVDNCVFAYMPARLRVRRLHDCTSLSHARERISSRVARG
jgi:hypothetical protein